MRIIGISGSPRGRQSNTRKLVERVLEGARGCGAEVELVDLGEMKIDYCIACDHCHAKGPCSRQDEFSPLRERMIAADGLVFGSPLYFDSVTAQLKTLIDRLPQVVHCQQFLGKYACSVATSGSGDYEMAIRYMNGLLMRLGCSVVGGVGGAVAIPGSLQAAEQDALALGRDLAQAITEQRKYPDQEPIHADMRERFKRLVTFRKDDWVWEHDYWNERGWL